MLHVSGWLMQARETSPPPPAALAMGRPDREAFRKIGRTYCKCCGTATKKSTLRQIKNETRFPDTSSKADQAPAVALFGKLDEAAAIAAAADPKAIGRLADEPRPRAIVRRVPPI
jgi:hypothetical protein